MNFWCLTDGVDEGKRNNLFLWAFSIKIFSTYDIRHQFSIAPNTCWSSKWSWWLTLLSKSTLSSEEENVPELSSLWYRCLGRGPFWRYEQLFFLPKISLILFTTYHCYSFNDQSMKTLSLGLYNVSHLSEITEN